MAGTLAARLRYFEGIRRRWEAQSPKGVLWGLTRGELSNIARALYALCARQEVEPSQRPAGNETFPGWAVQVCLERRSGRQ